VRVEFVGRRLTNLAEINLLVEFDLDGDNVANAVARIDAVRTSAFRRLQQDGLLLSST
jgi:hypothetical protein